jgi:Ca-activated chloride channel family protein
MQRHVVVYGLAIATLAGAFLLAPRVTAPKPPPVSPLAPPSRAPVTELTYGDGTLSVTARLDRGFWQGGSPEPVWMDVAVRASGVQTRAPLAALLVIDRSGSMAGDKIDAARLAAEQFVRGLSDGDLLGVITYGSDVSVELSLAELNGATRSQALDIVRRIEEGGGTNIDGALLAAADQFKRASLAGRVARVILVSDGRPTEGDRRPATLARHVQALRTMGATTSTLGLGLDYNEDLMEALAVDGGGRYHYLRSGETLGRILDDELQHGRNVVARGVKLHMPRVLADGLSAAGVPGQKDVGTADKLVIDIGDLAAGEERHVLVKMVLGVPSIVAAESGIGFAAPELLYVPAGKSNDVLVADRADAFRLRLANDVAVVNASRLDDVRVRVLQVEASLALTSSMAAWSAGDGEAARKSLAETKASLATAARRTGNAVLLREAENVDRVLESVAKGAAPASPADLDIVKAQKARAFDLRR